MTTNFDRVRFFREKFRMRTVLTDGPRIIADDLFLFRYRLCAEELHEMLSAHCEKDVVKLADALADLLYVVYGMAHECGIPIDAVFKEVHRSNMLKELSKGKDDPRGKR